MDLYLQQVTVAEQAAAIATDLRCEHSSFRRHPISAHHHIAVEERVKPRQSKTETRFRQAQGHHVLFESILSCQNQTCAASSVTIGILAQKPWDLPLSAVHQVVLSQAWREITVVTQPSQCCQEYDMYSTSRVYL